MTLSTDTELCDAFNNLVLADQQVIATLIFSMAEKEKRTTQLAMDMLAMVDKEAPQEPKFCCPDCGNTTDYESEYQLNGPMFYDCGNCAYSGSPT